MNKLLLSFALFCVAIGVFAQKEITVKSFKTLQGDLSACVKERFDLNNRRCALVKIQYPEDGATFEGNIIGDVQYRYGEYWVYMPQGRPQLRIHLPKATSTIILDSSQFDINKLEQGVTYNLIFLFPKQSIASFYFDAGMSFGATMGPEISLGTYLGGFNIEGYVHFPLNKGKAELNYGLTKRVTQNPSITFGGRLGYGIKLGETMRLTPQAGVRYMRIKCDGDYSDEMVSIPLGIKFDYLLSKHFNVGLRAEYIMPIDADSYDDEEAEIKGWNNGFAFTAHVGFEF